MTVCAAGICQGSSVIVTISDRMATWGHGESDQPLLKTARLTPFCIAMIAADDVTRGVEDAIRDARATLAADAEHQSLSKVKKSVLDAWSDTRHQRGAAAVLSPFGMTVQQFLTSGLQQFGEQKFLEIVARLETEGRLESTLLICGFTDHKIPWLVACDDDSPWHDFTRVGYASIGCGAPLALSSLAMQGFKRENDLHRAIYQLCVAKFNAETDPHVGHYTVVVCFRDDGRTCWISSGNSEWIRRLWQHAGNGVPDDDALGRTLGALTEESRWTDI